MSRGAHELPVPHDVPASLPVVYNPPRLVPMGTEGVPNLRGAILMSRGAPSPRLGDDQSSMVALASSSGSSNGSPPRPAADQRPPAPSTDADRSNAVKAVCYPVLLFSSTLTVYLCINWLSIHHVFLFSCLSCFADDEVVCI